MRPGDGRKDRNIFTEHRFPILDPEDVVRHAIVCPKCNSGQNCIESKPVRGGHELTCKICGKFWERRTIEAISKRRTTVKELNTDTDTPGVYDAVPFIPEKKARPTVKRRPDGLCIRDCGRPARGKAGVYCNTCGREISLQQMKAWRLKNNIQ